MTMRPAPKPNGEGYDSICDIACGACTAGHKVWFWHSGKPIGVEGWLVVTHCPVCGRPLGFDAEGNPTVGLSADELQVIAAWLAERAVFVWYSGCSVFDGPAEMDAGATYMLDYAMEHVRDMYCPTPTIPPTSAIEMIAERRAAMFAATERAADAADPEEVKHASEN